MSEPVKTIQTINDSIRSGQASVLTQRDLQLMVDQGRAPRAGEVDVVVLAWSASVSGTAAMLLVPVAGRGVFTRAARIWLNGVEGYPGPAPNERLGVVDTLIFTDQVSRAQAGYTGADLMVDLLSDRPIQVECRSIEGGVYRNTFVLSGLQFARLYVYNAFLPASAVASHSGSADQYRFFDEIRIGDKILVNGAVGLVAGSGTRNRAAVRALSVTADMFEMNPESMVSEADARGVKTSHSLVLPVPVRNQDLLDSVVGFAQTTLSDHYGQSRQAEVLKNMMVNGEFLLTDSDRRLGEP